jgi:DNA-binding NtrC family response regulator
LDDIPLLVEFFTEEASTILKKNKPLIPVELYDILKSYSFPGNVRELRSMIFDAVAVNNTKYLSLNIFRDYLGLEKEEIPKEISLKNEKLLMFDSALPTIREAVNLLIDEALFRTKGNQSEASKILGITPQALSRRLKFRKKEAKT